MCFLSNLYHFIFNIWFIFYPYVFHDQHHTNSLLANDVFVAQVMLFAFDDFLTKINSGQKQRRLKMVIWCCNQ